MREEIQKQLWEKLRQIPEEPGVYQMLDKNGQVIYIGKSKCLKKRVLSYFAPNPAWEKAEQMVRYIQDIAYIITETHLDAQLLECAMIKEKKPYFNVLMKNHKRYVYLKVEENFKKPPLKLTGEREGDAFGPLRSRRTAEDVILFMRNLYPIEKEKRTFRFQYHILPENMNQVQFESNRSNLLELCQNPKAGLSFVRSLERAMKEAAHEQKYELALRYRDLAQKWRYLQNAFHGGDELSRHDAVYTVPVRQGYKCFYIRDGLVLHTKTVKEKDEKLAEQYRREILCMEKRKIREQTEVYLAAQNMEKGAVDFRTIVYGEVWEKAEGTQLYILK